MNIHDFVMYEYIPDRSTLDLLNNNIYYLGYAMYTFQYFVQYVQIARLIIQSLLNTLLVNIHSIPYAKWMHKQNVPRQNVPWDKSPKGQNVPMDKTSLRQKRPRDKNVPRDQTSQGDK